jgi:hypothetical protein
MDEKRSNVDATTTITLTPTAKLVPAMIYTTLNTKKMSKSQCAVMNCKIEQHCQPGMTPICHIHTKYFKNPRGWAFVYQRDIELINVCRSYGIYDQVQEFAREEGFKIENATQTRRLSEMALDTSSSITMMSARGSTVSEEDPAFLEMKRKTKEACEEYNEYHLKTYGERGQFVPRWECNSYVGSDISYSSD